MELALRFSLRPPRAPPLDIDVEIASRAAGISGPSGIGKSTLLRIIAGVERRAFGLVALDGMPWQDSARGLFVPPWERSVGWVPQDCVLFPHLSVRENLLIACPPARQRMEEVLTDSDLHTLLNRQPRHLSGGERQRVALARALVRQPKLLLLDEPFASLDRAARGRAIAAVRRALERDGCSLLLVTHDARDQRELADLPFTLAGTRLVLASGTAGEG